MASTGIQDGGIARLIVNAPAVGTVVTHLINCSLSYSHDPREITSKSSSGGAKEYAAGLTGWTMSGEAYFAEDATYGHEQIHALISARTLVQVQYGSRVAGDNIYRGAAFITANNRTAGNQGENESYTIEIQGSGALTEAVLAT